MFQPSFLLDTALSPLENYFQVVQDIERCFEEGWEEDDEETATLLTELARLAVRLMQSARAFQPQGQITTLEALGLFVPIEEKIRKQILDAPMANETIEMELLKDVHGRAVLYKERLRAIIGVVRSLELHGWAAQYLSEMSALYFDGHDNAVFIVARSALEESLEGALERRLGAAALTRTEGRAAGRISLEEMINLARREGLISHDALKKQAHDIRFWGNWAVHERQRLAASDPAQVTALKAITSLAAILKDLATRP